MRSMPQQWPDALGPVSCYPITKNSPLFRCPPAKCGVFFAYGQAFRPSDVPVPLPHRRVPQHLARRFAQISSSLLSEVSTPLGLLPWQFALIVQLSETPGMDRGWLAAAIGSDAASTGQALNQFVERGWVWSSTPIRTTDVPPPTSSPKPATNCSTKNYTPDLARYRSGCWPRCRNLRLIAFWTCSHA